MPAIPLENDGLKAHVKEVIRQILEANDEAARELGTTIEPRFKITFSAVTVSAGGLNGIKRPSSTTVADQFTDSTEEPVTTVTESVRNGEQTGTSSNKLEATSTQDQATSDKTATTGKSTQSETNSGTSKTEETSTSNATDTSKETGSTKSTGSATQAQANNTRQETVTEYVI